MTVACSKVGGDAAPGWWQETGRGLAFGRGVVVARAQCDRGRGGSAEQRGRGRWTHLCLMVAVLQGEGDSGGPPGSV